MSADFIGGPNPVGVALTARSLYFRLRAPSLTDNQQRDFKRLGGTVEQYAGPGKKVPVIMRPTFAGLALTIPQAQQIVEVWRRAPEVIEILKTRPPTDLERLLKLPKSSTPVEWYDLLTRPRLPPVEVPVPVPVSQVLPILGRVGGLLGGILYPSPIGGDSVPPYSPGGSPGEPFPKIPAPDLPPIFTGQPAPGLELPTPPPEPVISFPKPDVPVPTFEVEPRPVYQPQPRLPGSTLPRPVRVPGPATLPAPAPAPAPAPVGSPGPAIFGVLLPWLVPSPKRQPRPIPQSQPFPRSQPQPAPQPRPQPAPVPQYSLPRVPQLGPQPGPRGLPSLPSFSSPQGAAFASPGLTPARSPRVSLSPQTLPEARTDDCNCTKPPKQRKPRKPRTICYRGEYVETAKGTTKFRKRKIPCR
jgi:hypothetical protein